jgi:hypothetical protein
MLDYSITIDWFIKVFGFYGIFLMQIIFLLAAGMLLAKFKNGYTAMFFFGLLVETITNIAIRVIIEFRLIENMDEMQRIVALLSTISIPAYFVQVIGFLLFVFHFIEHKNN